jgi:hypothetical protein
LSVCDGEVSIVAYCHSGCDTHEVLRYLGVKSEHHPQGGVGTKAHARAPAVPQDDRALWLWRQREPIEGSPAERYLRQARGFKGPVPTTLGFIPRRDEYPPSLIAAFGLASEPECGVPAIADGDIRGVHITRLQADGSAKAGTDADKIIIGRCVASPIVLAPPNDGLGLAICEGIEEGLSVFAATGLSIWAAGSAARMAALADVVPPYIDVVTIVGDRDPTGERGATDLASRLKARGFETRLIFPAEASCKT